MDKKELIKRSVKSMERMPEKRLYEVVDFIDFIYGKCEEEEQMQKGIEKIISQSESFAFLNEEEDIYEEKDLIEKY